MNGFPFIVSGAERLIEIRYRGCGAIFRIKEVAPILELFASEEKPMKVAQVQRMLGISQSKVWRILTVLCDVELMFKNRQTKEFAANRRLVKKESIYLNPYDSGLDKLLANKAIRPVLHALINCFQPIPEELQLDKVTIWRAIKVLLKNEILEMEKEQFRIRTYVAPERMTQYIPNLRIRSVIELFANRLDSAEARKWIEAAIVYGKASIGAKTTSINILIVTSSIDDEKNRQVAKAAVEAEKEAKGAFANLQFRFVLCPILMWFDHKLCVASPPSLDVLSAFRGIPIIGEKPPFDKKRFFEEFQSQLAPTDVEELLRRGYVESIKGEYTFTDLGLKILRSAPPTKATQRELCNGVLFIYPANTAD